MQVKVKMFNIRNDATRWQLHDFLSDGNSNACSISHNIQDIRKSNKTPTKFDKKYEVRGQGG